MLDLDKVKLVREFGTKGQTPMLKHLKRFAHKWPVYGDQKAGSSYIDGLGTFEDMPKTLEEALKK
jgi:hypothetical protein